MPNLPDPPSHVPAESHPPFSVENRALDRAAARLLGAAATGTPCTPVRDLIGASDVAAAYEVQKRVIAARLDGRSPAQAVVGRKIGLTSPAVQQQLGVDRPDFGVLLREMERDQSETIGTDGLLQPRIEAEIAFVLGRDLDRGPITAATVREAVSYATPALEIVDSRIGGWDITFADTVADNASSGLFVLGDDHHTLDDVKPVSVEMSMTQDGEEVSSGNGAACLGDPLEALAWLGRTALELGDPLRAGQVILSGALGPMVPVQAGAVYIATITGLGHVRAQFAVSEPTAASKEPSA